MDDELPSAYDLGPFARLLLKSKHNHSVGRAIEQMVDAYSAHADMVFAHEIMIALNEDARIENETGTPRFTSVERGAMFAQAVIYYARATTVSGSRRRSDLVGKLSAEEQAMHKAMEDMRHKAFAHFEKSAAYKGLDFAIEKPILVIGKNGPSLRTAIKRMVLNVQLYGDVLHQVEAMLAVISEHIQVRSEKARAALWAALEAEPELGREINKLPFDAQDFFSDAAMARDFLTTEASMTQGEFRGDEAEILVRR